MHIGALQKVHERHPQVFKKSTGTSEKKAVRSGELDNFNYRGLIYEVAQSGAYGTINEVERVNIWDFFDYMSYIRSQNEYSRRLIQAK